MIDQGFLRRECKNEARREALEHDYNNRYERIADAMIAEARADGESQYWQPKFADVHAKVMAGIEADQK